VVSSLRQRRPWLLTLALPRRVGGTRGAVRCPAVSGGYPAAGIRRTSATPGGCTTGQVGPADAVKYPNGVRFTRLPSGCRSGACSHRFTYNRIQRWSVCAATALSIKE
jgi:hypothetical protein